MNPCKLCKGVYLSSGSLKDEIISWRTTVNEVKLMFMRSLWARSLSTYVMYHINPGSAIQSTSETVISAGVGQNSAIALGQSPELYSLSSFDTAVSKCSNFSESYSWKFINTDRNFFSHFNVWFFFFHLVSHRMCLVKKVFPGYISWCILGAFLLTSAY